jgi:hypothetical protein
LVAAKNSILLKAGEQQREYKAYPKSGFVKRAYLEPNRSLIIVLCRNDRGEVVVYKLSSQDKIFSNP